MPWAKGESGNLRGRPPKGRSLAELLEQRLPREQFVDRLIRGAMGELEDVPPLVACQYARLLLAYSIGTPRQIDERRHELKVTVEYVNEGEPADPETVIDISQHPMIEAGEGDDD